MEQIRLNSTLSFDEKKEKDILEAVNQLAARHKLTSFISDLLKIALEQPEAYQSKDSLKEVIKQMSIYGMTPTRYKYFNKLSEEVREIKDKVDKIYDMSYKTYMLGLMGKKLGIEKKSENLLRADFVLQKQLNELRELVGIEAISSVYTSDKVLKVQENANEVLEYILESYDSILEELKNSMVVTVAGTIPAGMVAVTNEDNTEKEDKEKEEEKEEVEEEVEEDRDVPKLEGDRLEAFKRMTAGF